MPLVELQPTGLTPSHMRRLAWFQDHAGEQVPFPRPIAGAGLLVTRAKGIYKPAGLGYALSVRVMLSSPYADKAVERQADGSWSLDYYQENVDPSAVAAEYTNRGLFKCRDDGVPVGVLVQLSARPAVYEVIGLAAVSEWSSGFFRLEGARLL